MVVTHLKCSNNNSLANAGLDNTRHTALGGLLLCCNYQGDGTLLNNKFTFSNGMLQRSDDSFGESFGPLAEL
jgi:hypothetical protein